MRHLTLFLFACCCCFFSLTNAQAQECIDQSKVNPQQICTKEYNPVCGCDGQTYTNRCMAQRAGVTTFKKGKCPIGTKPVPPSQCIDKSKVKLQQVCPRVYNPVCGCNGKTYNNSCEAQKMGVTTFKKGKCPAGTKVSPPTECIDQSKINPQQPCTKEYNPVCGCDGQTYSNRCMAQRAGVTAFKKGKCPKRTPPLSTKCVDKSKVDLQKSCPKVYAPVCGCDHRTYNNACEAEKMGVTAMRKGKCQSDIKPTPPTECIDKSKINPQQPCTKEYNPVCGCDGKTYSNRCMAEKAGLTAYKKGKCPKETRPTPPSECIDQSKINRNQACPKIYNPVCGCNGKTYNNSCEAQKMGVTTFKKGKCPKETRPTPPSECIDQSKINQNQACPKIYSPVCGCDGKTYTNRCLAENAGVTSFKKGRCRK